MQQLRRDSLLGFELGVQNVLMEPPRFRSIAAHQDVAAVRPGMPAEIELHGADDFVHYEEENVVEFHVDFVFEGGGRGDGEMHLSDFNF